MPDLHNDAQPPVAHPLAPAQTAIRYCLSVLPGFCAWATATYGTAYPPRFFDDLPATAADLAECHNAIGALIDEAVIR